MPPRAERELLKRYRAALRAYIQANTTIEGLSGPQFDAAYKRAEEARTQFELARQEMLQLRAQGEGA